MLASILRAENRLERQADQNMSRKIGSNPHRNPRRWSWEKKTVIQYLSAPPPRTIVSIRAANPARNASGHCQRAFRSSDTAKCHCQAKNARLTKGRHRNVAPSTQRLYVGGNANIKHLARLLLRPASRLTAIRVRVAHTYAFGKNVLHVRLEFIAHCFDS